jgi:hypothetical protein
MCEDDLFMCGVLHLLLNEFDPKLFPPSPPTAPLEWDGLRKELYSHIEKRPDQLIVVLGGFGYGKSAFISYALDGSSKGSKPVRFRRVSFINSCRVNDAYMHLISPKVRILVVALLVIFCVIVAQFFPPASSWIEFLLGLSAVVFFVNAFRLTYLFMSIVSCVCDYIKGRELVIIEDLERGALPKEDSFVLLSNRWKPKKAYLAAYGFDNDIDRGAIGSKVV